ncbi:hypothetical protein TELCIR_10202 [Teladorsagia circumcincta]|uniref:Protein kinase domain-containing protein n=1 Tax=Teladorsagia circumcincta TaxID=45464 RepID=A0A2G9UCR9_TELCI|nr:hypothetical protein TELCIR_10202 [Teladorsagia circumcincta]
MSFLPCISTIFNCDEQRLSSCGCRSDSFISTTCSPTSSDSGYDGSCTCSHETLSIRSRSGSEDDDLIRCSPSSEEFELQPIHYNVIKDLGSGSFGEVSLIENPLNWNIVPARKIALKRIRLSKLNARQKEEADYEVTLQETLSKTEDIRIVHCYGSREDRVLNEKHIYLEYVDGSDLFEIAMNKGGVGRRAAGNYFRQLLEGLAFLHGLYVAHRDIKPENLLIDKRERSYNNNNNDDNEKPIKRSRLSYR